MKLLPVFALKMGGVAFPKMIGSQCVLCQGFRSSAASAEPGLPTTYCFIAVGGGGWRSGEVHTGTVWFLLPQDCSL